MPWLVKPEPVCLHVGMQVKESSFRGDRPECPRDGRHRVHRHGFYEHYKNCDSAGKERVRRFLCVLCGITISVTSDNRLPYRSVSLETVTGWFDRKYRAGADPPSVSEKEQDCVKRALRCFESHSPALRTALGQIVTKLGADAGSLWRTLSRLSKTGSILRFLQAKLKPLDEGGGRRGFSLLGTYRWLAVAPISSG